MKIVFFGTPEFAIPSLQALIADGHEIAAVVTAPDKPGGRNHRMLQSDVKKFALANGLPLLQPVKLRDPEFLDELRNINADLFVVIAFRMLPEAVWAMPPRGTFNLHAALLPKYRGAAPINHAIINGETETGVTTFLLDHDIDTGEILSQRRVPILPEDNVGTLYDRLMHIGAEEVVKTVRGLEEGTVTPRPQPDECPCPAPKLTSETCRIDWNRPAREIHNLVRGLSPYPGAWTMLEGAKCKILKTMPNGTRSQFPGHCGTLWKEFRVGTADEDLEILSFQPAGKKPMSPKDYLNGHRSLIKFES